MKLMRDTEGAGLESRIGVLASATVVLGILLLGINGPLSRIRNLRIVMFVIHVLPVVVAVLAYRRTRAEAGAGETVVVAAWGLFAIYIATLIGYFAFPEVTSDYAGPLRELVNDVLRFLLTVGALGGLYAGAGAVARRGHPIVAGLVMLFAPVGQFLVYALLFVV